MLNATRVSKLIPLTAMASLGIALLVTASPSLKADAMSDNKATVTFDRPVEVPGKVLPPGVYVFKSVNNDELVQVFSGDEKHLFATVSVIPEDRPAQESDHDCFVQLSQSRSGTPQEVEGYFVSGRLTGFQFVYPASQTHRGHN